MYGSINTSRRYLLVAAFLGGGILSASYASAQGVEAKLKAAYVANIASFVRWPIGTSEVRLCVSDTSNLYPFLKELDRHPLGNGQFISLSVNPQAINDCHIAFSDQASGEAFNAMLLAAGTEILTVSDMPEALQQGFNIQLFVRNLRLRFSISTDGLDSAPYQISSKLLRLSRQLD